MRKSLFFIILISFISCNNQNNTNSLVLNFEAVIQHSDSINTYYTTNNTIDFNDFQSFKTKIEGSSKNQKVKIVFPDSIKPNQIRLDFGKNTANQEIVLNKIELSYLESHFEAKGEEIYWYFRPDENNTLLDKKNGVLKRKSPTQLNGPSLYPKGDKLKKELDLLYKKRN